MPEGMIFAPDTGGSGTARTYADMVESMAAEFKAAAGILCAVCFDNPEEDLVRKGTGMLCGVNDMAKLAAYLTDRTREAVLCDVIIKAGEREWGADGRFG